MLQKEMTTGERRVALSLAGVFSARMLGLFMIVPVFALYAKELDGYSPSLAGLAIGIYGLTQAVFQIPLGMLSDRIGRKPVIIAGLILFLLGSIIAAMSDSLTGIIIGRSMQGAGAIASAVMALAADLTREENRIKVMAFIGISIGLSFSVAMVLGPIIHGWFSLSGIFWTTGLLAVIAILIVALVVPTPVVHRFHRDTEVEPEWFKHAVRDTQLLRVDFGIFSLHLIFMAMLIVLPQMLLEQGGLEVQRHWLVYLPVLFLSILAIVPFIIIAEKKHKLKQVLTGAVIILCLSQVGLYLVSHTMVNLVFMLLLFFAAFNLLEAMLPSLVAKLAPVEHKGTAMGVYSTSQFLGIFAGASIGGWLVKHYGETSVFIFTLIVGLCWLLFVATMRKPKYLSSHLLNIGTVTKEQAEDLAKAISQVVGVVETTVIAEDGVAYLKVDKKRLNMEQLQAYSNNNVAIA